jgi:hypothetical protein
MGVIIMKNKTIIILIFVVIIALGAGFFCGMKYQESRRPANFRQQAGNLNPTQNRQRINGGGQVMGDILSFDGKTLTVKLTDGSSKIVLLPDSAMFVKTAEGAKGDLKVGDRVGVFGMVNNDGSVTAQNVQINPVMRVGTPSGGTRQ